jgi:hypothetical protein
VQGVANSAWALARLGCYSPDAVKAALESFGNNWKLYKPQASVLRCGRAA